MIVGDSLEGLALALRAAPAFAPAAWAEALPGLAALAPSTVREASVTSIARRQHKVLLALRVAAAPGEVAARLLVGGLDLRGGHVSRGDDAFFLEAEEGGARVEAHLIGAPMAAAARVDAVARGVGVGPELVALAVEGVLVEVGLTRAASLHAALVVHVQEPFAAEQRLVGAGFAEAEVRGVPALVRGAETVLLAGGTWYAYAGGLPAELPIAAEG